MPRRSSAGHELGALEEALARLLTTPATPRRPAPARRRRRRPRRRLYAPAPFAASPGLAEAIRLPSRGVLAEAGARALAAIAAVHEVPVALPLLRLEATSNSRRVGHYLFIDLAEGEGPRRLRAAALKASRNSECPELHLLHELGHLLDHVAIGHPDDFASVQRDPLTEPVISAARASEAYASLAAAGPRRHRYLAGAEELFARAYPQWIALRSEDPLLADQVRRARLRPGPDGRGQVQEQWADEDFAPIASAFDQLALRLGWIRPRRTAP